MPAPHADSFHVVEGGVSGIVVREGFTQFEIGGRSFALIASRTRTVLRRDENVRVLVNEPEDLQVLEVLVLKREGSSPEYVGPGASIGLSVTAALLLALAVDQEIWLLAVPALLLAFLQLKFSAQKETMLRRFAALSRQMTVPAPPVAPAAPAAPERPSPASPELLPADIPLTLPTPALAAKGDPSAWPSEILEFTHDAIIIWELDGAGIVYWNRAAEQLYGYSRQQAQGQVTHQLLQTRRMGGTISDVEAQVARYGVWVGELCHTRRDGQVVEVEARLSLMSQERRPWLVLEVNRDVTDRNRAEAARQEMTKQLERARQQT